MGVGKIFWAGPIVFFFQGAAKIIFQGCQQWNFILLTRNYDENIFLLKSYKETIKFQNPVGPYPLPTLMNGLRAKTRSFI